MPAGQYELRTQFEWYTTYVRSGSIITADEIRTSHLTLVDNHGKTLVETQGINGVEVRSYLPHNVIQR